MDDDRLTGDQAILAPNEVAVDYIKAPDFRVVWTDDAAVNVTPVGMVHVAAYAERHAIPRRIVLKIGDDEELGEEVREKRYTRGSLVREMGSALMMTPETAVRLGRKLIAEAERAIRDKKKSP
jgi:hypothetical protein